MTDENEYEYKYTINDSILQKYRGLRFSPLNGRDHNYELVDACRKWLYFLHGLVVSIPMHLAIKDSSLSEAAHETLDQQIKRVQEIDRLKTYRAYLINLAHAKTFWTDKKNNSSEGLRAFSPFYHRDTLEDQLEEEIKLINQAIGELTL